jgi:hypothetical protein
MECDLCGETFRKREARETINAEMICPDCADDKTKCEECELLFDPEGEETICRECRGGDEDEAAENDGPIERPSVDAMLKEAARQCVDQVAVGEFYGELRRAKEEMRKEDHLPRLRAEVRAELAAMNDAELTAWVRRCYSLKLTAAEMLGREQIPDDECERRLVIFTAELRRCLQAQQ